MNPFAILGAVSGVARLVAAIREFFEIERNRRRAVRAGDPDPVWGRDSLQSLEHLRRWAMMVSVAGALPFAVTFPFMAIDAMAVLAMLGIMVFLSVSLPAILAQIALGLAIFLMKWKRRQAAKAQKGRLPQ